VSWSLICEEKNSLNNSALCTSSDIVLEFSIRGGIQCWDLEPKMDLLSDQNFFTSNLSSNNLFTVFSEYLSSFSFQSICFSSSHNES
jgi:hypothetical protein